MDWRHTPLLVAENILCRLDLADLKSATEVCRAWLNGSAKAFETTCRVAISNSTPDEAPDLVHFFERFKRHKEIKFKLSGRAGAPNGPNSLLADLPLDASSRMTHLTLDYEPTAEVLEAINSFLCELTSKFPALQELQIFPNADPPEDLVSPSLDFLLDNLVPAAENSNLRVLRAPVGPNWGSGIDWRFLTPLKKLERLDLRKLQLRGGAQYVHRQLLDFVRHFPAGAQISQLNLHLGEGEGTALNDWLGTADLSTLSCAFKTIKPETCTLYFEQLKREDGQQYRRRLSYQQHRYLSVVDRIVCSTLKRFNVHYLMKLSCFKECMSFVPSLTLHLRQHRKPGNNSHVLLRIDLCRQGITASATSATFIELECAQFQAPLLLRHGPTGDFAEDFQLFLNRIGGLWPTEDLLHRRPAPNYNALRKYTFDENQEIVGQEQFRRVGRNAAGNRDPLAEQPEVLGLNAPAPAPRGWVKTNFLSSPRLSSIVNGQSSWKPPLELPVGADQTLPVNVLQVYSMD